MPAKSRRSARTKGEGRDRSASPKAKSRAPSRSRSPSRRQRLSAPAAKRQAAAADDAPAPDKMYEVETILKRRLAKVQAASTEPYRFEYLVKWAGYPKSKATWEPRDSLRHDVPLLVDEYEAQMKAEMKQFHASLVAPGTSGAAASPMVAVAPAKSSGAGLPDTKHGAADRTADNTADSTTKHLLRGWAPVTLSAGPLPTAPKPKPQPLAQVSRGFARENSRECFTLGQAEQLLVQPQPPVPELCCMPPDDAVASEAIAPDGRTPWRWDGIGCQWFVNHTSPCYRDYMAHYMPVFSISMARQRLALLAAIKTPQAEQAFEHLNKRITRSSVLEQRLYERVNRATQKSQTASGVSSMPLMRLTSFEQPVAGPRTKPQLHQLIASYATSGSQDKSKAAKPPVQMQPLQQTQIQPQVVPLVVQVQKKVPKQTPVVQQVRQATNVGIGQKIAAGLSALSAAATSLAWEFFPIAAAPSN